MKKSIKIIFLFIILIGGISTIKVNALETEYVDNLIDLGQKMSDRTTDIVKLENDIEYSSLWSFNIYKDKTLDLAGHSLIFNKNISMNLWYFDNATVKIIDSSFENTGKIIKYFDAKNTSIISNVILYDNKITNLVIENINFESESTNSSIIGESLGILSNITIKNSTIKGFKEVISSNASLTYLFENIVKKHTNNIKTYLIYNDVIVNDVISNESKIIYYNNLGNEAKDRNIKLSEVNTCYGEIKISNINGLQISKIFMKETYNESVSTYPVIIENIGESDIEIKSISIDNSNFFITDNIKSTHLLRINEINQKTFTIKPKEGLKVGTYTGTLLIKDTNNKEYTAKVLLEVNKKNLVIFGLSLPYSWTYKEEVVPTVYNLEELSNDDYEIIYFNKDTNTWSNEIPFKTGKYIAKFNILNNNYTSDDIAEEFEILPISDEIKIIPDSSSYKYDGNIHSNNNYKIYYNNILLESNRLPNNDIINVEIEGSIIDVIDNKIGNNKVKSYKITSENGKNVTNCYNNVIKETGTLIINKITTPLILNVNSGSKYYDGIVVFDTFYTSNKDEVLIPGDNLYVNTSSSALYVGKHIFKVNSLYIDRNGKDITANYTIGNHNVGIYEIKQVIQYLNIEDIYLREGEEITIEELKEKISGNYGKLSFEVIDNSSSLTWNSDKTKLIAGPSNKSAQMKVITGNVDLNNDGIYEYIEAEKYFKINIINKDIVVIKGLNNDEVFTYDGKSHKPTGKIYIEDDLVSLSDLDVLYEGIDNNYSSDNAPKNAGKYIVTYKVKQSNLNYKGSASYNFSIKKSLIDKTILKEKNYEYNGKLIKPNINIDSNLLEIKKDTSKVNAGNYQMILSVKDKTNYEWNDNTNDDLYLDWSIVKATPEYNIPDNLIGIKGKLLKDVLLPNNFKWSNPDIILSYGKNIYNAIYTPDDTNNYNIVYNIPIKIDVKNTYNVVTSVINGNGKITEGKDNLQEGSTYEVNLSPNIFYTIDKIKINGEYIDNKDKLKLYIDKDYIIEVSYKKITSNIFNPNTSDNIYYYFIIFILTLTWLLCFKKINNKNN